MGCKQHPKAEHHPGSLLVTSLAPTPAIPLPALPPLPRGLRESPDQVWQDKAYLSKRVIARGQIMTRQPNRSFPFPAALESASCALGDAVLPPSTFLLYVQEFKKKKRHRMKKKCKEPGLMEPCKFKPGPASERKRPAKSAPAAVKAN